MSLKKTRFIKGIILAPDIVALEGIEGEVKVDAADGRIRVTLKNTSDVGTLAAREVVTNSQTQTLTNKTLTSPVIDTSVSGSAIEPDLALSASSSKLATASAIKAYVDAQIGEKDQANEILTNPSIGGTVGETIQDVLENVVAVSGVSANDANLGTFTGTTIPDSSNVKGALQTLETVHEEVDQNVNDLITLSGVAENSTDLGTFTGTIIADASKIKGAIQALETHTESHTSSFIQHGVTSNLVGKDDNQTLTTKTIDADNNTISNLEVDNLKLGVLNTSTTLSGATDLQIPSALATKTYIESIPSSIIVSQTSFTIANNQISAANITGLSFNPALFRGVEIKYSIYRQTDTASSARAQMGQLRFIYNTQAAVWYMSDDYAGQDAGVEFSIDNASGQIRYTSSDISGANYVGTLKYSLTKTFGV